MKANRKTRPKSKNDNALLVRLGICTVIAALYFYAVAYLSKLNYSGCMFFDPGFALIPAFLVGIIIIFSSFVINAKVFKQLKAHKKKLVITILIGIIVLVLPVSFLKAGTVADQNGIQKKNVFGKTTKEYAYEDIASFEMTVQHGIMYDIEFDSDETVSICSHQVYGFNAFRGDSNMIKFDKLLSRHGSREIGYSYSFRLSPSFLRKFFAKKQTMEYFLDIFNSTY